MYRDGEVELMAGETIFVHQVGSVVGPIMVRGDDR